MYVRTREVVEQLLRYGFSQAEIVAGTGRTKSTIAYHMRRLGQPADDRFNRRYDWSQAQRFYDAGNSITACQLHFGFSRKTFNDARDLVARSSRGRRRCPSMNCSQDAAIASI